MVRNVLAASVAWQCWSAPSPQPSRPSGAWGRGSVELCWFLLADGQQRRIATGRRGVDGERALAGEAQQVVRAAGLGTGAGEAFAAERLHADHRADLVAVDVTVADAGVLADVVHGGVDAAVHAEGEAVAGAVELVDDVLQLAGLEADQVQHRAR